MAEDFTTRKSQLKGLSTLILHISKKYLHQLGNIRNIPNCWAAAEEDLLWLKFELEAGVIPLAVEQLPAKARYWVDEEGRLFPMQGLTPVAKIPALDWSPIATFIPLELPIAALPAEVTERVSIRLIRSKEVKKANFLLLPWKRWKEYALAASNIRLKPLTFAVSEQGEAVVHGKPLPPLPGQLFWQTEQVLLPAGWDFEYPIIAEILANTHTRKKNTLLLYQAEKLEELPAQEGFIQASRSAIRKTEEHLKTLLSP